MRSNNNVPLPPLLFLSFICYSSFSFPALHHRSYSLFISSGSFTLLSFPLGLLLLNSSSSSITRPLCSSFLFPFSSLSHLSFQLSIFFSYILFLSFRLIPLCSTSSITVSPLCHLLCFIHLISSPHFPLFFPSSSLPSISP